jgi:peptidoglycan hydrolase-like protein with peptidoglycan-binding domain
MIKFPDPDTLFGADVAHWQRFLKSRGLYGGDINGQFDSATQRASFDFQRREKLHEKEPVDDVMFDSARSLGYEIPEKNPSREYFNREGRVELSLIDRGTLNRLAYCYYLWTGERITVTSGTRTPREQGEAMYDNWYYRRNEGTRYTNREAEEEIRRSYDDHSRRHGRRSSTVDAMTSVIENQMRHGTYISLHLRGRAVDIRTRDMSSEENHVVDYLARQLGVRPLDEEDHYHLQFR